MKRDAEEIKLQIEGLKKERERLPHFSMFGDDNHKLIDAQISVLEGKSHPDDYYEDESAEEYEDGDNSIYFDANDAADWLIFDKTDDLF